MLDSLITLDQTVTLFLNGSNSLFWDGIIQTATQTKTWIPILLILLYVIVKNKYFKNPFSILIILISVGLCILLADQGASGICKPLVQRFRPTNDPFLMYAIDTVNGYRGGRYGFFSSHAANTFSVAMFFSLLIKYKPLNFALFSWALLNCYTRIYLGVHYVGDILVGILWGCIVGILSYGLCRIFLHKTGDTSQRVFISAQYTSSNYLITDIQILILSIIATYFYIVVRALFFL